MVSCYISTFLSPAVHDRDLEKDVSSETSGYFRKVLLAVLAADRDPEGPVDQERARADAQSLFDAGEGRWGTEESV